MTDIETSLCNRGNVWEHTSISHQVDSPPISPFNTRGDHLAATEAASSNAGDVWSHASTLQQNDSPQISSYRTRGDHLVPIDADPLELRSLNVEESKTTNLGSSTASSDTTKATGYPRVAAFISNDPRLLVFKRFDEVRVRVGLHLQAEIEELKEELWRLDEEASPEELRSIGKQNQKTTEIINKLEAKMKQYDKLLIRQAKLVDFGEPMTRYRWRLQGFLDRENPLEPSAQGFIRDKDDLVALSKAYDEPWVYRIIEDCLRFGRFWFGGGAVLRISQGASQQRKLITNIGRAISAIVSITLLALPIALMVFFITSLRAAFAIVVGFTMIFMAVLCLVERPKKQELFVSAATYFAVLAVNLGSIQR